MLFFQLRSSCFDLLPPLLLQGLQELYDFVQGHPDAYIAPYFELCSPEFRNFVQKSLRNIARQRARGAKGTGVLLSFSHMSHVCADK